MLKSRANVEWKATFDMMTQYSHSAKRVKTAREKLVSKQDKIRVESLKYNILDHYNVLLICNKNIFQQTHNNKLKQFAPDIQHFDF